MKKGFIIGIILLISLGIFTTSYSADVTKDSFFLSSLHFTSRGMEYWYDKSNGGLEMLTGIPYKDLSCKECHTRSCDSCHAQEESGKFSYSIETARKQETCLHCHKREESIMALDKKAGQMDVHVSKEMQCSGCHSGRDVHGDGKIYESMKQPGAIETTCEKCHAAIPQSKSHMVHGEKLECKACHIRQVLSCTNCHFETLLNQAKRVAIPVAGWTFLMNYRGKVTSANMQNFVVKGGKTFLMFAPQNSHSVMKEGRLCDECHATPAVTNAAQGNVDLTWLENGEMRNLKGVIPVVQDVNYHCVYQEFENGKWVPIQNPPKPLVHYAGYGTPLSKEQLKKMAMPFGRK